MPELNVLVSSFQEYECNSPVDPCTLLTLVGAKLYRIHRRLVEQSLLEEQDLLWCPNVKCGRAITISAKGIKYMYTLCS